jgi:hypothetical protein
MIRLFSKLLVLLAVLLLPLGMTPAGASVSHASPAAGMPMQHCPEQGGKHETKGGFAECTMACSASLPAADLPQGERPLTAATHAEPADAHSLHGLHPDTATPPPKLS